jgi:hypothetical protein
MLHSAQSGTGYVSWIFLLSDILENNILQLLMHVVRQVHTRNVVRKRPKMLVPARHTEDCVPASGYLSSGPEAVGGGGG